MSDFCAEMMSPRRRQNSGTFFNHLFCFLCSPLVLQIHLVVLKKIWPRRPLGYPPILKQSPAGFVSKCRLDVYMTLYVP